MAELKNNFLKGKMNKDLDERLVPSGEYRDALNVEVSASEGSDTGTIQNLLGNTKLTDYAKAQTVETYTNAGNAKCVGKYVDTANDKIYWFTSKANDLYTEVYNGQTVTLGLASDCILEYDYKTKTIDYVATDVHTRMIKTNPISTTTINPLATNGHDGVVVGMKVEALTYQGVDLWGANNDVRVTAVSAISGDITISHLPVAISAGDISSNALVLKFSKPKVLRFSDLIDRVVTGINVLNDNIFYTDNLDEPKSINIERSKEGTTLNQYKNTLRVRRSNTTVGGLLTSTEHVTKEDISVIKINPKEPPTTTSTRVGEVNISTTSAINATSFVDGDLVEFDIPTGIGYLPGDTMKLADASVNYFKVLVTSVNDDGVNPANIVGMVFGISGTLSNATYGVTQIEKDPIFKNDIVRFAYRFIYEENEVSCISPFSPAIFSQNEDDNLDGDIDKKGYLFNDLASVTLSNFVPPYTPHGVKAVELLMKRDNAAPIYSIARIERGSDEWDAAADGDYTGSYLIVDDIYGGIIESNQILRPWDNVPRKALAQEVTANRLLFGNYVENYDMVDSNGAVITLDLDATIVNYYGYSGLLHESVKSNRKYQLGVVYIDDMGREAPVLTSKDATVYTPYDMAETANRISVKIKSNAPYWAKSYKIFIKDVSQPHMTAKVLFAGADANGDWFLGFASSDSWKVEVGDTFYVKKPHNQAGPATSTSTPVNVVEKYTDYPDALAGSSTPQAEQGKFWIKVNSSELGSYIDDNFTSVFSSTLGAGYGDDGTHHLGYIEIAGVETADAGIFYEASQAFPIHIDTESAQQYIKVGSYVTGISEDTNGVPSDLNATLPINTNYESDDNEVYVTDVVCSSDSWSEEDLTVTVDTAVTLTIPAGGRIFLRFHIPNVESAKYVESKNTYVEGELVASVSSSTTFKIKKRVHPTPGYTDSSYRILLPWFNCYSNGLGVEAMRLGVNASDKFLDKGVKVSTISDLYEEDRKSSGLIFSGIVNPSIVNNSNQFIQAENITKRINTEHGSIQKLHSRNTDVVVLCEDKCLKVLSSKDALFNADGNANVTSNANVLGQAIPFQGNFGISKNPESFASYGYRSYFTDKARGAVIRLSMDGITVISDAGMRDWFNDNLDTTFKAIGSFDNKKQQYNITLNQGGTSPRSTQLGAAVQDYTLSFNEGTNGWESFKSFIPEEGCSLNGKYYTFKNGDIWQHRTNDTRNNFYGTQYNSEVTTVFNSSPDIVKSFKTLSYEGSQSRIIEDLTDSEYYNNTAHNGWYVDGLSTDLQDGAVREFKDKENKWFNYIHGVNTTWTNDAGAGASGNVDTQEFSVQGIGTATTISGSGPTVTYTMTTSVTAVGSGSGSWTGGTAITSGIAAGTSTPSDVIILMTPLPGYYIDATNITIVSQDPSISGATFAQYGNEVKATISFNSINFNVNLANNINLQTIPIKVPVSVSVGAGVPITNNDTVTFVSSGDFSADNFDEGDGTFTTYQVVGTPPLGKFSKAMTVTFTSDSGYHYKDEPSVNIQSQNLSNYRISNNYVTKDGSGRITEKQISIEIKSDEDISLSDFENVTFISNIKAN